MKIFSPSAIFMVATLASASLMAAPEGLYRWVDRWQAPAEPVNLFLSPPFPDYVKRPEDMMRLVSELRRKAAVGSVLVLQADVNSTALG